MTTSVRNLSSRKYDQLHLNVKINSVVALQNYTALRTTPHYNALAAFFVTRPDFRGARLSGFGAEI